MKIYKYMNYNGYKRGVEGREKKKSLMWNGFEESLNVDIIIHMVEQYQKYE